MKVRKAIRNEAIELLRDVKFLFRVGEKAAEMGVVGERKICLTLFLAALTSQLEERVSILVKGPSSSGKNNALKAILSLLPPEYLITRSSLTKKSLAHTAEELDGKVFYIFEMVGGKDAQYLQRELQSEGSLQHEHTVLGGGSRTTKVARVMGAPVFLTTTTSESVFIDDETRFLSLRADESEELTRAVLLSKFEAPIKGNQPPAKIWQEAFRLLTTDPPKFRYPDWFKYIAENIPAHQTRARRDAARFISLLKAVALCRSFSDGRRGESKAEVEIDLADYCGAYEILNEAFSFTFSGSHPMEHQVAEAVQKIHADTRKPVTTKQVADHNGWEMRLAYKWTDSAALHKLIQVQSGTQQKNLKLLLPGVGGNAGFLPDPLNVLRKGQTAVKSITYVAPLSGELKKISHSRGYGDE